MDVKLFVAKYWKWIIAIGGLIAIVSIVVYLWKMGSVQEKVEEEKKEAEASGESSD